jgi:hypothetical protein
MTLTANVAFFHPRLNIRYRLKVWRLYDWDSHTLQQGLLLGSKQTMSFVDQQLHEHMGEFPNPGSRILWTLEGHTLHTDKKGWLTHASIMPTRTQSGSMDYRLTQNLLGDDDHLVLIKTGLLGNPWDYMRRARRTVAWQGRQPVYHGARALNGGARRLVVQNGEDLDQLQFLKPPRGKNVIERLCLKRAGTWEDTAIPTRRYELWQISPGGEILVGDIFAGHEHMIAVRQNTVVATNVSKKLAESLAGSGNRQTLFDDPEPAVRCIPQAA